MPQRSKGHIAFENKRELFEFTPPRKAPQIYRAPIENFIETGIGVRTGARFEAYAAPWWAARERERKR